MVFSQSSFLYDHSLNNSLMSLSNLSSGDYVINMNLKYEIEWDYDYFQFGVNSLDGDILFYTLTGHDYELNNYFVPFTVYDEGNLYLNFSSDASLNYRGVGIDYLSVYKKPEGECDTGDLNQDAIVDILDIVRISDLIIDNSYIAFERCVADLNQDDIINVIDIIAIINVILEIN